MPAKKILLDVTAGSGLGIVNGLETKQTLILNGLIILGRIVLEIFQSRRERKRKEKEKAEAEKKVASPLQSGM
jgi:preprotein translocase subunit SecG